VARIRFGDTVKGKKLRSIACRLFICVAVTAGSSPAFAQENSSARTRSLGGNAVSGIIPDFLTDLSINPAYGHYADSRSISYGYRTLPNETVPFIVLHADDPYIYQPSIPYFYGTNYANELTAFGLRRSGWTFSLTSAWRFDTVDNKMPDLSRYSGSTYYEYTYRNTNNVEDIDYWQVALSAARAVWGEYAIGFRLGGGGWYYNDFDRNIRTTEEFRREDELLDFSLSEERSYDTPKTYNVQRVSTSLQIGIIHDKDGRKTSELAFIASRSPLAYRRNTYDQYVLRQYTADGEISQYEYEMDEWRNEIEGDIWHFGLLGRYRTLSDVRIYMGGHLETTAYDSDWRQSSMQYDWYYDTYSSARAKLTGEGDSKRVSLFTKVGRTSSLHRILDLTIGVRGDFLRSWSSEKASASYHEIAESPSDRKEATSTERLGFKHEYSRFYLNIPAALELRATGWLSCFACFISAFNWERTTTKFEVPSFVDYMGLPNVYFSRHGEGQTDTVKSSVGSRNPKRSEEVLSTTHAVTLGFSIHYKNTLFIDLYTGADLTPDNVNGMILDVRYMF
jgi:hypothetical protein